MAVDKLVDSALLDAQLLSVANAIRAKGETNSNLAFPAGFISAIESIPSGSSGLSVDDIATHNLTGAIVVTANSMDQYAFYNWDGITGVTANNCHVVPGYAFRGCTNLESFVGKNVESLQDYCFRETKLVGIVIPNFQLCIKAGAFYSCSYLEYVDIGAEQNHLSTDGAEFSSSNIFYGCSSLDTIVLRKETSAEGGCVALSNVNSFSNTPFANGGIGGTIYIPKSFYDHLGDGTALDYKAATNWSTLDGYGTITWAKIEGSIYETKYADGTFIGS